MKISYANTGFRPMLYWLSPLLLSLGLVACKPAEQVEVTRTEPAQSATSVVAAPLAYRQVALADINSGTAMQSRCDAELAAFAEGIRMLEQFSGQPDAPNYLEPLNTVIVNALNMSFAAGTMAAVHPDEAVRTAADACTQAMSGVQSDFSLSRPIYDQVSAVDTSAADANTQRFQEKLLLSFRLSGVDKDEATRARIKQLNEQITAVGQEFDNNIRDSVGYLELQSADQLAGLPEDYIAAHPPGEDGLIRISTQYPDFFPFMSYSENDQLRHDLSVLYNNRAYPENEAILQ
ncbi:MAG TPA: hypothetical protein VJN01_15260, partial [Xanthomonadales bacterium]|nr:hypothetical protein [Xanthomonadales bacterium]